MLSYFWHSLEQGRGAIIALLLAKYVNKPALSLLVNCKLIKMLPQRHTKREAFSVPNELSFPVLDLWFRGNSLKKEETKSVDLPFHRWASLSQLQALRTRRMDLL